MPFDTASPAADAVSSPPWRNTERHPHPPSPQTPAAHCDGPRDPRQRERRPVPSPLLNSPLPSSPTPMKKALLLLLVLALAAAFFASGLHRQLDLDALKAGMGGFAAWRRGLAAARRRALLRRLCGGDRAVAARRGGDDAGRWRAVRAGLGAPDRVLRVHDRGHAGLPGLAPPAARQRAGALGERLKTINDGIARDGAFYLFSLRLVPAFPFFLINLLMGLTPIRTRTFYWVSQLGMLPGTLVYVNAGTELGAVHSLAGVLSPGLVASFVLLGLFPLIARWIAERVQARRVYAGWTRPTRFERNLVVIGAGAAGLVTSYIAAAVKARVTLVEAGRMGGDCLNTGCVPSKALIRSARLAHHIRHAGRYGLEASEPAIDFRRLMERVRTVIEQDRAARQRGALHRPRRRGAAGPRAHRRSVDGGGGAERGRHAPARHAQHRHRHRRTPDGAGPARAGGGGLPHQRHAVGRLRRARHPTAPAAGAGRRADRLRARAGLRAPRLAGGAGGPRAAAAAARGQRTSPPSPAPRSRPTVSRC